MNQDHKILGELGTIWATYELTRAGWDVFRKLNEKGYDLLARRNGKEKLIEVKTVSPADHTGKNKKYVFVGGSAHQNQNAEYYAAYVHKQNVVVFFPTTLPVVESHQTRNGIKIGEYVDDKFIIRPEFAKYLNNCDLK